MKIIYYSLLIGLLCYTVPATADWLGNNLDDFNAQGQCPFAAGFSVAVIQPVNNSQYMLQCMNNTGSAYYNELGAITIDSTNAGWVKQAYPPMYVCIGKEPEDCRFFKGDS